MLSTLLNAVVLSTMVHQAAAIPTRNGESSAGGFGLKNIFRNRARVDPTALLKSYDYIIVGGGTSGLVVANRLSEDAGTTVLVIEAGDFHENEDFITIPALSAGTIPAAGGGARKTKYDWNLNSTVQSELGDRVVTLPQGKVIGGSSVLNSLVYMRASAEDYNRWEELGNPGWNFKDLLPYFMKSETFTQAREATAKEFGIEFDPAVHGTSGPVQSSYPNFVWPSAASFVKGWTELGVQLLKDGMAGALGGSFWYLYALDPKTQTRISSQVYLTAVGDRANLHVLTGYQVTKLITEVKDGADAVVTGVEYTQSETAPRSILPAAKEVILAAGALHTPQLLQLSGIGDKPRLIELGINVVADVPGVGQNYQDHLLLVTAHASNSTVSVSNFGNATWAAEQRAIYDATKEGPLTTVGSNVVGFLALDQVTKDAAAMQSTAAAQDLAFVYPPSNLARASVINGYAAQHKILTRDLVNPAIGHVEFLVNDDAVIPALQQPFSRGSVFVSSNSSFGPANINSQYLTNPIDRAVLVAGFKHARALRATAALSALAMVEVFPGEATVNTDEQIVAFINANIDSIAHHAGTASMLPFDLGGVVNSKLQVYGIQNLRVVDASIIPMIPAAHIQASVYAIAEKAADLIKGL